MNNKRVWIIRDKNRGRWSEWWRMILMQRVVGRWEDEGRREVGEVVGRWKGMGERNVGEV